MKLNTTHIVSGVIISTGISLLIAGCVMSIVPMIVVGLSLFLAGGLYTSFRHV